VLLHQLVRDDSLEIAPFVQAFYEKFEQSGRKRRRHCEDCDLERASYGLVGLVVVARWLLQI
jgi:hypothetical protein